MFQAILQSRKTVFASIETAMHNKREVPRRSPHQATKATLETIISGGHAVYVGVGRKPTKVLAKFLKDYYEKGGELERLYLFADTDEGGDEWPLLRKCEGPTAGVCRSLIESLVGLSARGRAWPEVVHPAVCATGYLVLNGGDRVSADAVVSTLGDIRYAIDKSKSFGFSAAAIANHVWAVESPSVAFCSSPSIPLANAVVRYCEGNENPQTFCDHLIAASLGRGTYKRKPGLFANDMIECYGDVKVGIAAAAVAALKLVVTSWASSEFHSDIFDDTVFSECDPDGRFQTTFRQFCDQ